MTLQEAVDYGSTFLSYNGVDEYDFKALCLACAACGLPNSAYRQNRDKPISMRRFADLLWRVKSGEPLQYVLGSWDFYKYTFSVGEGVLIPRPETEELVERVLQRFQGVPAPVVYDLCAGSGCIGLSVARERPDAFVYGVEKYDAAMHYLLKNANADPNFKAVQGDVLSDSFDTLPPADCIVSNPPYIAHAKLPSLQSEVQREPATALDGGTDGLVFYRAIAEKWLPRLKAGGILAVEIGEEQGSAVQTIFAPYVKDMSVLKDSAQNDRIVIAKKLD